jgi:hypothetical protein
VFQTAAPSKEDVYFSANYRGANDPTIYYFAGYDRSSGPLDSFSVAAVPEPESWAMMLMGFGMIGVGLRLTRGKKPATLSAS